MKNQGRIAILAALAACLSVPAALAQSPQPAQNQQNAQDQNQDQTSGVSHPPPDSTIEADEDSQPTYNPPPPAKIAKPSPAIPMAAAPTTVPMTAAAPLPASSNPLDNTDYGIVTVVPAQNAGGNDAALQTRGWNPDDDLVNYVPSGPNQLAAGTNFEVRLSQDLSTAETERGQAFSAVVVRNVYKNGQVIIPAGATIRGHVVQVTQGHHVGPHATLRLRPEAVVLPDGSQYHIDAVAVQSLASGTRTNDEGGIVASHHYAKDAIEYGAGTGAGAVAGAEIAGPVGAGVGSMVGAGLVSAHMLIGHPEAADLPNGSLLIFSLTQPMSLTPTHD